MAPLYTVIVWICIAISTIGTAVGQSSELQQSFRQRFQGAAEPTTAAAEYGEMVRPSRWRSPADQLAGFHLPPGFEIRLFAAEPDIAKPLNLAIDSQGRVWMTQTTAYPKPAEGGSSPTDAVMILQDTIGDGHADRITTFASGLNIPIGVLPYGDGCICFSIPNLYYLRDTTGDGVCDTKEVLLGPFDTTRDTHGMVNSLRDGGDGWIYACHGFNNRSVVKGRDGHEVRLESGNTFRFRPDGSRIEQVTQGQVNPFGMTRDEWGYWYSADCHSKPITQLIRGACYPSFGRTHDGLGFLPPTVEHLHGSTAISGILSIASDSPIAPLQGQIISGNVMTSRLNRNLLVYHGATARGEELTDFLTSDDSWFRPVDLQIDSSGNIYVADFYNKIIGHYEVPLDHPDRDRTSGRVWQIRYVGNDRSQGFSDRSEPLKTDGGDAATDFGNGTIKQTLQQDPIRARIHTLNQLGQSGALSEDLRSTVTALLRHENAHLVRAAAELIGRVDTDDADTFMLIQQLGSIDIQDPVLRQTFRIAIRNRLSSRAPESPVWQNLRLENMAPETQQELAAILLAVHAPQVVRPIIQYLERSPAAPLRNELIRHTATLVDEEDFESIVSLARRMTGDSSVDQGELLELLLTSQSRFRRESKSGQSLRKWALEIATASLDQFNQLLGRGDRLIGWTTTDGQAWGLQSRPQSSGSVASLMSSHTRGESYVGKLLSDPFPAPATIQFWLAGHAGSPGKEHHGRNLVRLIRVSDGVVLHEAKAPRNDTAQLITWHHQGAIHEQVRIECHDGDAANAYAWIALGQFDPPWVDQAHAIEHLRIATRWAERLQLKELNAAFKTLLHNEHFPSSVRLEIALAIGSIIADHDWLAILSTLQTHAPLASRSDDLITLFIQSQGAPLSDATGTQVDSPPIDQACRLITSHLSSKDEAAFVQNWLRRGGSPVRLINMGEAGWLNRAALAEASVAEILKVRLDQDDVKRLLRLTENLSPTQAHDEQRHRELVAAIESASTDLQAGAEVFKRHCFACHQVRGIGSIVGPQLDGVLSRTTERLVEDITMPDRNVDAAFRTTSLLLDDGRAIVGMIQTEDESEIKLADPMGKIVVVEVASIQTRIDSSRSLMPNNFIDVMTPVEFASLFQFLRVNDPTRGK